MTTKIHACVDALGNPLRLILTGGQVADVTQGAALVANMPTTAVSADKGYDSDELVKTIVSSQPVHLLFSTEPMQSCRLLGGNPDGKKTGSGLLAEAP